MVSITLLNISFCWYIFFLKFMKLCVYVCLLYFTKLFQEDYFEFSLQESIDLCFFREFILFIISCFLDSSWALICCIGMCTGIWVSSLFFPSWTLWSMCCFIFTYIFCDFHSEFLPIDSPLACKCGRKPDHVFKVFFRRDLINWEVCLCHQRSWWEIGTLQLP